MFHRALVVKVLDGVVTFSVRTDDSRVDVYTLRVEAFRDVLRNVKEDSNRQVHIYLPTSSMHMSVFSVYKPDFDVMVSEFEAQL